MPKLDVAKYCRLNDDICALDEYSKTIEDDDIQIYYNDKWIAYTMYKKYANEDEDAQIKEFAKLVGRRAIETILLFRKP